MGTPMSTDPLLDRLRRLTWPETAGDQPDPVPGQLWRAAWGGIVALVVTLEETRDRTVNVAASTVDEPGDERTVVAQTLSGFMPLVWASVSARIKAFTLEHRIADLTADSFAAVREAVAGDGPAPWAPIEDVLDDRTVVRAELIDTVQGLAEAEWLHLVAAPVTLSDTAADAGFPPSEVARVLGITPGDARRLLRGVREPKPAEAERLTALFGSPPPTGATYDEQLVMDMDAPEFRPAIVQRARHRHGADEAEARRALASEMMAMAARQRGPGARNWKALLRETLRED